MTVQVCTTENIQSGKEILVAYGARWLTKEVKKFKVEAQATEERERCNLARQVYVHPGAAPRWHCLLCKKFVARPNRLNHVRLCKGKGSK